MYRLSNRLIKKHYGKNNDIKLLLRYDSSQSIKNNVPSLDAANQFPKDVNINISTKLQTKLPPRKPLAKNFFLGIVDKELLAFPEVIPREDMSKLKCDLTSVINYFDQLETDTIDSTLSVPKHLKVQIKELGLYGLNVGQHYGGKGYFWSENLVASELENKSPDVASILLSHRLVIDVLNNAGNDDQKQKYLEGMANGSIIATEAIFESAITENQFFNTIAEYDDSNQQWKLNGEKSFVVNGFDANLFLVLAQTTKLSYSGDNKTSITMFLVDSTLSGVSVNKSKQTFGLRGAEHCTVNFNNVILSDNNIIGKINEGNEIAQLLLRAQRLKQSLLGFGITKKIINNLTEHSIVTKHCGVALKDMEMTTDRLSKLVCKAYAMESMIYFTSGLMDEFQNQDVDLEVAITKLYCMKNLWSVVSSSIDVMGAKYFVDGEPGEIDLRNACHLLTHGESLESLRLFIALTGLQHAGLSIHETINKERNPLFHPGHMFNKFLKGPSVEAPRLKLLLGQDLHPSLEPAAQCLELSIARLQMCTEILLTRYGNEIIEKHVEIKRLTEMVTLIYAMFTSLSRSSRSYCIGLHLADHELLIATAISLEARDRIKAIATDIDGGPYLTNDRNLQRISKQILKSKGYFVEHPLTYNY